LAEVAVAVEKEREDHDADTIKLEPVATPPNGSAGTTIQTMPAAMSASPHSTVTLIRSGEATLCVADRIACLRTGAVMRRAHGYSLASSTRPASRSSSPGPGRMSSPTPATHSASPATVKSIRRASPSCLLL